MVTSKYKGAREPVKPSPEISEARQKIADDLADYIDGHRTDQPFDTGTIRPLLDAARVLAFSAAVNDPDGSPVLDSKAAANTLTTLIRPFCDGDDLQDVVTDAVDRYLATYPQPADGTPTIFEEDQAQAVMDEMTRMTEPLEEAINGLTVRSIDDLDSPIDKVNSVIWDSLETDTGGQMSFAVKAEPDTSKKPVNILYAINFDNIETDIPIVKRLEPYDRRVYTAVGGLVKNGYLTFTDSMIYHAMGHTGRLGKADRVRIHKSMTKFHAIIYLSNQEEIDAGYNYPSHVYDGPLLPFYRDTKLNKINGQIVESTYSVYLDKGKKQIPLIDFAVERDQYQTITTDVYAVGLNDTNQNIDIQDYLLERIAKARTGHGPKKILLSTLYDRTHLTTYKQKQRAPEKIRKCLDHYKDCNLVKDYDMDKKSITLKIESVKK